MSQPPDDHLKALWKSQDMESEAMTVAAVRLLVAGDYQRRRTAAIWSVAIGVFAVGAFAWSAWKAPSSLVRLGDLIMLAWVPWVMWQTRRRWPQPLPRSEVTVAELIEFQRAEILRQKQTYIGFLVVAWPLVMGIIVGAVGLWRLAAKSNLMNLVPIAAAFGIWVVALVVLVRRQRRKLQAQLDDIDTLRR